ncbi:MAG: DinB family protein [Gemmatimonadota bacterium]
MAAPVYERPAPGEYAEWYAGYVKAVGDEDLLELLARQWYDVASLASSLPLGKAEYAYAPGKWMLKEVIGHLSDAERVFSYRILRIARADETPLAKFDENAWMGPAKFTERKLGDLVTEFQAIRQATLAQLRHLPPESVTRIGIASGWPVSVRALGYIIAGHVQHHLGVIRERYLA